MGSVLSLVVGPTRRVSRVVGCWGPLLAGAAVRAGVARERGDAEAEVLAERGDIAGIECFALAGWFGADGVPG